LPKDGKCGSIQVVPGHSSGGWASAEETAAAASAQQAMSATSIAVWLRTTPDVIRRS
jgi:predicted dienelactone hydrolase